MPALRGLARTARGAPPDQDYVREMNTPMLEMYKPALAREAIASTACRAFVRAVPLSGILLRTGGDSAGVSETIGEVTDAALEDLLWLVDAFRASAGHYFRSRRCVLNPVFANGSNGAGNRSEVKRDRGRSPGRGARMRGAHWRLTGDPWALLAGTGGGCT